MNCKTIKILCTVLAGVTAVAALSACSAKPEEIPSDKDYLENLSKQSFWENDTYESIPEYQIYHHVHDFLSDSTVENGDAVSKDGKIKKVLFLGFDGMRADAVANVVLDENEFDTGGYNNAAIYSGINEMRKTGGVYFGYCGGEKDTGTQQTTSTSASWTSQFTGVWGDKHGVKTNDDIKNMEYKTFMLEYAEQGLQTSLAFDWDQYLDVNLKEEVKYVMARPEIQMTFCDIDRTKAEKLKKTRAETLELFNFVAPDQPSDTVPYDTGLRDHVLKRMEAGDDIISGIFHNIDSNGHTYAFSNNTPQYVNSVRNCDNYAYEILQAVKEREAQFNEQWLIVMANDHGGIQQRHGEQTLEERTTWIASNYKLDKKYYSNGYNGFNVKS